MGVIRVYSPNGQRAKIRGKFRMQVIPGHEPRLVVEHKGTETVLNPLAVVFRGQKCVYSPRQALPLLSNGNRKFCEEHTDWGYVHGSMPSVLQVVQQKIPVSPGSLAQEMCERVAPGQFV